MCIGSSCRGFFSAPISLSPSQKSSRRYEEIVETFSMKNLKRPFQPKIWNTSICDQSYIKVTILNTRIWVPLFPNNGHREVWWSDPSLYLSEVGTRTKFLSVNITSGMDTHVWKIKYEIINTDRVTYRLKKIKILQLSIKSSWRSSFITCSIFVSACTKLSFTKFSVFAIFFFYTVVYENNGKQRENELHKAISTGFQQRDI